MCNIPFIAFKVMFNNLHNLIYLNQDFLHRRMLPKLVSVLNVFITFTRSSITTRVNEAGLVETVPVDQARMDYDPITLAQKRLAHRGGHDEHSNKDY
jgi:hypothetical protein